MAKQTGNKDRLGCSAADRSRKSSRTKHVESIWSPCMDAGSTPASSTIKQKTTTPKGVFVFQIPLQACLQKVDEKQKNHAQRGGCFLFAGLKLRDGRAKRGTPAISINKNPAEFGGCFLFAGMKPRDSDPDLPVS